LICALLDKLERILLLLPNWEQFRRQRKADTTHPIQTQICSRASELVESAGCFVVSCGYGIMPSWVRGATVELEDGQPGPNLSGDHHINTGNTGPWEQSEGHHKPEGFRNHWSITLTTTSISIVGRREPNQHITKLWNLTVEKSNSDDYRVQIGYVGSKVRLAITMRF